VVAVPLPVAHFAWTVAPASAAPTAAVPLILVVTGALPEPPAGVLVVPSPEPPPQAESTAAAKPVNKILDFIPDLFLMMSFPAQRPAARTRGQIYDARRRGVSGSGLAPANPLWGD
jgi:hypothetical protein